MSQGKLKASFYDEGGWIENSYKLKTQLRRKANAKAWTTKGYKYKHSTKVHETWIF